MTSEKPDYSLSDAVVQVLSSYASRESATVDDILSLARQLPAAIEGTGMQTAVGRVEQASHNNIQIMTPAVPIEQSVTNKAVTCLCCGRSFTMIKRHLKAEHGLTEEEYRLRFGLDENHPLVAPDYSLRRAEFAKSSGLGKHARDDAARRSNYSSA